jgi:peptidoglycan/xylan/chitin deacetylase (PgdA/CDA1 family)
MLKFLAINALDACGGLKVIRYFTGKKPVVLMYHRILRDPKLPGIDPLVFEAQMVYLKKHFNVMNMKMFFQRLKDNNLPRNTAVITFDDGHQDFYTTAWPILRKYELPASLFITTDFVDKKCWLWPDLLRYLLLNAKSEHLELEGIGNFDLSPTNVLKTWNTLGDHCLTLSIAARTKLINAIAIQVNIEMTSEPQAPFNAVTWSQLQEMRRQGLDIGSHSVTHPILSSLSSDELHYEVVASQKKIAAELGVVAEGICYPNGMARDISEAVEASARLYYQYGLVAYPSPISIEKSMRIGRFGAGNNMTDFKTTVSRLTRNNNNSGEYK